MKTWNPVLMHLVCAVLILSSFQLVLPLEAQEAGATSAAPKASAVEQALPDSPGTLQSSNREPSNSPETSSVQSGTSSSQSPQAQSQSQTSASPAQKPVGTAAAESSNTGGVAASQPAGVAIAPAKQRRVRTIVLRVGALAAAGVAVGTVAALSRATPSKPPGAH